MSASRAHQDHGKYKTVLDAANDIAFHTRRMEVVKEKRKTVPCRIRMDGEFVVLDSGKSLWNCEGHAKNALRNHLDGYLSYDDFKESRDELNIHQDSTDLVYDYLIKSGRVEFVPVGAARPPRLLPLARKKT